MSRFGRSRGVVLGAPALGLALVLAACGGQTPSTAVDPTPTAAPTVAPTVAPPTTAPTAAPPTVPPTEAPTPAPTLTFTGQPFPVTISSDPVGIGKSQTIDADIAEGPTCTLKVTYPSGGHANVGKPIRPDERHWVWKWTIPDTAGVGAAKVTVSCTFAGDARVGTGSFEIVQVIL